MCHQWTKEKEAFHHNRNSNFYRVFLLCPLIRIVFRFVFVFNLVDDFPVGRALSTLPCRLFITCKNKILKINIIRTAATRMSIRYLNLKLFLTHYQLFAIPDKRCCKFHVELNIERYGGC